jgi:integrase
LHDLIPLGPAALPALGTLTDAVAYGAAEKALATTPATGATSPPGALCGAPRPCRRTKGIIAAYLSWLADAGRKASTIGRRAAAIGYHHKMAGHEPPTGSEAVKAVLRGIRRTIGASKQGKEPIVADMLMQMLGHCPDTLAGKRGAALLSLCFAGAFRRSEVVALEVDDLTRVPNGVRIRIKRSKTDQTGEKGQEIAVIRGVRVRPVAHLRHASRAARREFSARLTPRNCAARNEDHPLRDVRPQAAGRCRSYYVRPQCLRGS